MHKMNQINFENIVSIEPLLDGEQWLLTFKNGYDEILNAKEDNKGTCEKCYFSHMGICAFNVKGNLNLHFCKTAKLRGPP